MLDLPSMSSTTTTKSSGLAMSTRLQPEEAAIVERIAADRKWSVSQTIRLMVCDSQMYQSESKARKREVK